MSAPLPPSPPETSAPSPVDDQVLPPDAAPDVIAPTLAPLASTEACASEGASAELEPVILAVAFDVSGSMGKGDFPYHDRTLKWEPVVAATKAFLLDPASSGLSASLTFFPIDGSGKCEASSYLQPVVPLTSLPSSAFALAIDAATPATSDDWIGGTPTLAVLQGTYEYLRGSAQRYPNARHVVVLITDGYPQGCDDDTNNVESVAQLIAAHAESVPTYVVGVANPKTALEPDPPDVVSNLHELAESGGTGTAFIIDTGDATRTAADFATAIESIRSRSISCTLPIPSPPEGRVLDTDFVNVTYDGSSGLVPLVYSQDCTVPSAWRFDDLVAPRTITLCADTCAAVLSDGTARLKVEFGCERRSTQSEAR